jgi:NADH:ubiquinone oxidoreductase subunit F (NADH-binding)
MERRLLFEHIDVPASPRMMYIVDKGLCFSGESAENDDSGCCHEEVKKSGLRGRGGAGFPTGMKWSFPRQT